uniref:Large ribosomal subunit protein uL23c n=1 Tax=Codium fragile TaxID=3133 RepID=A0A6B9PHB5_CODFR|nr:50S ribosomal protein L23 [Codium fragile]
MFYDFVFKPVLFTEKTTNLIEKNKYVFLIHHKLSKTHIKHFFKKYYNLHILQINTANQNRQKKNIFKKKGYKKFYKRCILQLKKNAVIPTLFLKK